MSIENKTIVIGHKNPDTDSICAAIAYANLKNKTEGEGFEACRAGEVSLETAYVLEHFGVEAPTLVEAVPEGASVILVDHNEKTQCADGMDGAVITEIIDHHKIGNVETADPIMFINMPFGCTGTIITGLYKQANVEIEPKIAGLLLSAILSDTLEFRSPTCTERDKAAAEELAAISGVDIHEHALAMFGAGESIEGRSAKDVCYQDFKIFSQGDVRFGVGQGSFMNPANIDAAIELLTPYLESTLAEDETSMVFFMATNIGEESSRVIYAGEKAEETICKAFGVEKKEGEAGVLLPGVVSRKKQMIPSLLNAID